MNYAELISGLKTLKLQGFLRSFAQTSIDSEKKGLTYEQFLAELVSLEISSRRENRIKALIAQSRLTKVKYLNDYDYGVVSGVSKHQIVRLSEGDWVRKGSNLVLYGDIGVGKTHIALGLIHALCEKQFRCRFYETGLLIEELLAAKKALSLGSFLKSLDKFDLLVCDELGFTPQNQEGGELFFQLIAERYERKSILITTNLAYSDWGKIFQNEITTAAAIDRVIHHCETINFVGPSRRKEEAKKEFEKQAAEKAKENMRLNKSE